MPTVVVIEKYFVNTEFDEDFTYGTVDGQLLVFGSVEPAKVPRPPFRSDIGFAECKRYGTQESTSWPRRQRTSQQYCHAQIGTH